MSRRISPTIVATEFAVGFRRLASGDGGALDTRRASNWPLAAICWPRNWKRELPRSGARARTWKPAGASWIGSMREEQQDAAAAEQRLKAVENSLAETDARLRYRRIELNVELRWHTSERTRCGAAGASTCKSPAVGRCWRNSSERESASASPTGANANDAARIAAAVLRDQQAWLAVSRQLAADLTGEVARLARASASQQCVCRDAHPRLRPIAETIERQLGCAGKIDRGPAAGGSTPPNSRSKSTT